MPSRLLICGALLIVTACVSEYGQDWDADGVAAPEDCDDRDMDVYPGADEICDGLDNDCDGATDEGPYDGSECRPFPATDRSLVLGAAAACVLDVAGELTCWGDGEATLPPSGTWSDVTLHDDFGCGLTTVGSLRCWGDLPQALRGNQPVGSFVQVEVADDFACVMSAAGRVECWGLHGTLGEGTNATLVDFALADGGGCGVSQDGPLECFAHTSAPQELGLDGDPVVIEGMGDQFCAVDDWGAVACWGSGGAVTQGPPAEGIDALSVGITHACAVHPGYSGTCWGSDLAGQLAVPEGDVVLVLAAGDGVSCAIDVDDRVSCWGSDSHGLLEVPEGL